VLSFIVLNNMLKSDILVLCYLELKYDLVQVVISLVIKDLAYGA